MSSLFDKLANEENKVFSSHILSPVLKGMPIRVRIANIVMTLPVAEPRNFQGWGVFDMDQYVDVSIEKTKITKRIRDAVLSHGIMVAGEKSNKYRMIPKKVVDDFGKTGRILP